MKTPTLGFLASNEQNNTHFRFKVNPNFLNEFLKEHAIEKLKDEGDSVTAEKIDSVKPIILDWLTESDDYKLANFLYAEAVEKNQLTFFRSVELADYWVEFEVAENMFVKTFVEAIEYSDENQTEVYDQAESQISEQLNLNFTDIALNFDISARILP